MRIQIDLKREAIPQVVLNKLFKHTRSRRRSATTPSRSSTASRGRSRCSSSSPTTSTTSARSSSRRSKYELRKAVDRAHVLEGYLIALDNLDEVIALIRAADDTDAARTALMERFELSEIQAQAILDLRLRALTGPRAQAHRGRARGPAGADRRAAGASRRPGPRRRASCARSCSSSRRSTARRDERRTEIVAGETELELEDMIAEEDMVIAITKSGYIKRLPVTTYREQRRGGIGVMGMDMKDDDYIEHLFVASTHDYILFFTTVGKVYRLKVHELPLGSRQSKGRAIVNLLPFRQDEYVRAVIATRNFERGEVPRLRDAQGHRQEDRVRRLQHAAQGGRDHRHQAARGRRAHRRAPRGRRRTTCSWSRAWARRFASTPSRPARWVATRPESPA